MRSEGVISKKVICISAVAVLVTALFLLMPRTATLEVRTDPVEGTIYVDEKLVGTGSVEVILPVGRHTVSFGEVPRYNTPKTTKVDLTTEGETVVGIYIRETGVVAIETMTWLQMPGVTAGLIAFHLGSLYINGTKVAEGQVLKTLETGTYLLEFGDMPGFETPQPVAVTITNASSKTVTAIYRPLFQNISVSDAKKMIEVDPSIQVVDVRGTSEFHGKDGHLPQAINIPLRTWPDAADNLRKNLYLLDRNRAVIVYCGSGMGSVLGAGLLHSEGFEVYHMDGGLMDWMQAGYEVVVEESDES